MTDSARTLRPEELLAETEWLRALASHLVRDPGAADDAAQETAIAALRSPPAGERRPWLAQVLRNFTRQRHRAESRRARREEVAWRRAAEPSPDEVVERVETHRLLAELVAGLSEPNRTAVAMRYYDGLEPSEIAARLGVPAGTVRARIHRGLAELRERLDERHRGDRDAWLAALAPLAQGVGRGPRGGAATAARTTSATVAAVAATLVVTAAVVGVAISLSSSGGSGQTTTETAAAPGATQAALAHRVRAADETPAPQETAPRGDVVRLAGTVVDPSGAPVRDAVVVANPVRRPNGTWEWFAATDDALRRAPAPRVVSAAGGGFALDATKGGRVAVSATAPGLASPAVQVDADADRADLVLRLAPALGLAGDVWDEAAHPVAGAVVVVQRNANDVAAAVTDDQGRFDVPALTPVPESYGSGTQLLVSARDFAPVRVGAALGRGRVRVVLPRGQFVAGRVLRDDGAAVAGATVTIQPVSPSLPAPVSGRADESGAFRIGRVGATDRFAFNVHVVVPGWGTHVVSSLVAPVSQPIEVRLPPTLPLRGRVVDPEGKGLAGVRVAVRESLWWTAAEFNGGEGVGPVQRTVASGTDGAFEIPCQTECFRAYVAVADDDPSWTSEPTEIDPKATPPDSKSFEVRAAPRGAPAPPRRGEEQPPIAEVTGRVEDSTGRGIAGAVVAIGFDDAAISAITDADGAWRAREVPGRGARLSAWADGYVAVRKGEPLFVQSANAPTVVLVAGAPLQGVVTDSGGEPVPGALVRVSVDTGNGWAYGETRADSAGAFTIACVPPGKGRVWVTPGRADAAPATAEFVAPCESLRVTVPRGRSITGRALAADGSAIASTYLTWRREDGGPQDDTQGHQVTDADGRFSIVGVPEGRYRIDVSRFARVRVIAGTSDVEMRAGPPRAIAGRVVAPEGADFKRAHVTLARDDGPPGERSVMWATEWAYAVALDAEGRFRLPDVYDGTYAVFVDGLAGSASAVVRGVKPGDEVVEVRLSVPREIAGVLVDADGRPVKGGVSVKPASGFGPAGGAQSGDDGHFRASVPVEGEVVVEAWAKDNTRVRTTATPPASGEMRIEVAPKR